MLTEFHIGIDDTDSKFGGCTTYTAALIFEQLVNRKLAPSDFPWLVRLNPNIPWKTRGNGALAIHLHANDEDLSTVKQLALDIVERTSDPSIPSTDPAVVFLPGRVPSPLESFTTKALHDVIRLSEAQRLVKTLGGEAHSYGSHRGIVGAFAAIGYRSNRDHTYEIIAYRCKANLGRPRRVVLDSIRRMDGRRPAQTFNSVDPETGRVLVCPHGPDPVLLGIRGEQPQTLLEALREVEIHEPIERVMIFKTNQGTDSHFTRQTSISLMKPFQSVVVVGAVVSHPTVLRGGHVLFKIHDGSGMIDCAAYRPTGLLRQVALQLLPDDRVKALGGVSRGAHNRLTLNLEKIEILHVAAVAKRRKPSCSRCGASCESMGKRQGFRCRKCGLRFQRALGRQVTTDRPLRIGLYVAPPRANRHLTKPESRYVLDHDEMHPEERENPALISLDEQMLSQLAKLSGQ